MRLLGQLDPRTHLHLTRRRRRMAGVLLYTAAPDSEGTLGGLVRLGEAKMLGRLIDQALDHAALCAADPLCAEHDPVPDRSLHAAACHACTFARDGLRTRQPVLGPSDGRDDSHVAVRCVLRRYLMTGAHDRLLAKAAQVVCEPSADQAEALAYEINLAPTPRRILQVAGLAAPTSVRELCEIWIDDPAIDGARLADALRCAARAVRRVSSYEKVELIYTGPDASSLRRTAQALLEVIREAHSTMDS
ncbi:MAG: Zn-binding domain-containing protein [Ilumatobacteraceae bacterium]